MNILISGASGLIGSALTGYLTAGGHQLTRLIRSAPRPGQATIRWDPAAECLDPAGLEGFDAVVHLAGESLAAGRWTKAKKARIRDSRIRGTRLLSRTLSGLANPPQVFISASAIGYYGDRGDEQLDEESPPGSGFLAEVCRDWEAATQPAADSAIRVVRLRTGLVLAPDGGALAKMLPAFRLGLGGRLGSGRQYMSWITLEDVLGAVDHILKTDAIHGPINLVSPGPVTNRQFTRLLGRVLRRPTLLPAPAFGLRLVFGQTADELLLTSLRVAPGRLLASGYQFHHPELEGALRYVVGR